ncbi:MAG: IS200/IS605 family transposase [Melioribacteraceae bacterium]|jgi:putative transposase|nr:IS200/IS605 family transposase [Melioribacteraceae bacterium]
MAIHSYVKIWIHLVWGTHNHEKAISKELSKTIYNHLLSRAVEESISIEKLYIRPEHVHMLFSLPSSKAIENIVRSLKGESSYWINDNNITPFKFKWQRGYGAFSVSASQLEKVKNYIATQEEHHRVKTFTEEYNDWKNKYGLFD